MGLFVWFECVDVFDWMFEVVVCGECFDCVFMLYGVICWLFDLSVWVCGIVLLFVLGGCFVMIEFYLFLLYFDE